MEHTKDQNPCNRLIITYHKGHLKTFPNKGYCIKKRKKNGDVLEGGKSGHKLPWNDNFGQVEGFRCTSLEKALKRARGFYEQHIKEAVYWDEFRKPHQLKIKPAITIVPLFTKSKKQ